jgi:hypothetical protein
MILLNSLICLLLIVIFLHFIKFLKDRNTKKEGFSEINNGYVNAVIENSSINDLSPDFNGEILQKMKESSANKNKEAIINDTKTQEEINIEKHNQNIANELKNDIKEIMSINEDVKKLNESFKSRINK